MNNANNMNSKSLANIFATQNRDEEKKRRAEEAIQFSLLKESLSRLVKNKDFCQWLGYIHLQLGGSAFGQSELTAFDQGYRAALSFIMETLAIADGASELFASFIRRHYDAIARAQEEAHKA